MHLFRVVFRWLGNERSRKYFSHAHLGVWVLMCVWEGRGGEGTSHMVGCIVPVFLACCRFSLPNVSHPPFKLCSLGHLPFLSFLLALVVYSTDFHLALFPSLAFVKTNKALLLTFFFSIFYSMGLHPQIIK